MSDTGAAYPSPLHLLGRHDDDVSILLIHHLPEVVHRVLQAALGGNEDFTLLYMPPVFTHVLHGWTTGTIAHEPFLPLSEC